MGEVLKNSRSSNLGSERVKIGIRTMQIRVNENSNQLSRWLMAAYRQPNNKTTPEAGFKQFRNNPQQIKNK